MRLFEKLKAKQEEMNQLQETRKELPRSEKSFSEWRELDALIEGLSNEFNTQKIQYTKAIGAHEQLTAQILRLEERRRKYGGVLSEKEEGRVKDLDEKRWVLHREIEKIAESIGKNEHEVRSDIIAFRYSAVPETGVRGLLIVPHIPRDENELGYRVSQDVVPKTKLNNLFLATDELKHDGYEKEFPNEAGYLLIYNMIHIWEDGNDTYVRGKTFDKAGGLKRGRIHSLIEQVKQKMPDARCEEIQWEHIRDGVLPNTVWQEGELHDTDRTEYVAVFIDQEHVEPMIELIKKHPEQVWLTEKEYGELAQVVVTKESGIYVKEVINSLKGKVEESAIEQLGKLDQEFEILKEKRKKKDKIELLREYAEIDKEIEVEYPGSGDSFDEEDREVTIERDIRYARYGLDVAKITERDFHNQGKEITYFQFKFDGKNYTFSEIPRLIENIKLEIEKMDQEAKSELKKEGEVGLKQGNETEQEIEPPHENFHEGKRR